MAAVFWNNPMYDFLSGKDIELYWRSRWEMLRAQGYVLVTPHFVNGLTKLQAAAKEDGSSEGIGAEPPNFAHKRRPNMAVAYRVEDSRLVYIKRIMSGRVICQELDNSTRFFEGMRRIHPANHSFPILVVLDDELDTRFALAVTPYMPDVDARNFKYVEEVLDFVGQILLGLEFMHIRYIAHCDCSIRNIVVDRAHSTGGPIDELTRTSRSRTTACTEPKYYFIDSGLSLYQPPEDCIPEVDSYIVYPGHQDVPEYQEVFRRDPTADAVPYNPFQLDVFMVGNMIRQEILSVYSNVPFIQQLVDQMTHNDGRMRPSASESVLEWMSIVQRIPSHHRGRRLRRHHRSEPRSPSGKPEQSGLSIPVTTDRLTHRLQDIAKKAFHIASRNRSASVATSLHEPCSLSSDIRTGSDSMGNARLSPAYGIPATA